MNYIFHIFVFCSICLPVFPAKASTLLNSDPTFQNPTADKTLYNPHVVPTDFLGDWNISFVSDKMTMELNNTLSDMAHIAAGAFYDVDWSYGDRNMLPKGCKVTAKVKGNIAALTDGDWLRAGVAIAGKAKGTNDDFFTEVDFYWGSEVDPPFTPDCVLIHDYQYGVGENFTITVDLTSKLETYWNMNYDVWSVYVVIEAANAYLKLEVTEFRIWYEATPSSEEDQSPYTNLVYMGIIILFVVMGVMIYRHYKKPSDRTRLTSPTPPRQQNQ